MYLAVQVYKNEVDTRAICNSKTISDEDNAKHKRDV